MTEENCATVYVYINIVELLVQSSRYKPDCNYVSLLRYVIEVYKLSACIVIIRMQYEKLLCTAACAYVENIEVV